MTNCLHHQPLITEHAHSLSLQGTLSNDYHNHESCKDSKKTSTPSYYCYMQVACPRHTNERTNAACFCQIQVLILMNLCIFWQSCTNVGKKTTRQPVNDINLFTCLVEDEIYNHPPSNWLQALYDAGNNHCEKCIYCNSNSLYKGSCFQQLVSVIKFHQQQKKLKKL